MKLILAPTDFSKTSRNAINYAAELAKRAKAKLVLLHTYHPTLIMSETPVLLPLSADLEKESLQRMKKIRHQLLTKHGRHLSIELRSAEGLAANVINNYMEEHKVDLIVMGKHGAGYLEEKIIGSVTSDLIATSKVPVLSVSEKSKFKNIKKIVLATDYQALSRKTLLNPLKEMADMFHSHIFVLNVMMSDKDLPTLSQAAEGVKLKQQLEGYDHSFHAATNENIVEGINHFVDAMQIDLIVMVPRDRNFYKSLFAKRNTKAMAFHSQASLLTIHN